MRLTPWLDPADRITIVPSFNGRCARITDAVDSVTQPPLKRHLLNFGQRQVRSTTDALEDWLGHCSLLHFGAPARRLIRLPAPQKVREPSDVRERRVRGFLKSVVVGRRPVIRNVIASVSLSSYALVYYMDESKNAHLISFAAAAGISESLVQGCRDARMRGESLARHLHDLLDRRVLSCTQTRHLLVAAFDFSIGHVQIVHLWCDGAVNDAEFEDHLFFNFGDHHTQ